MKVKLSLGESDIVGYKNINPFTNLGDIHDNEAYEIYVSNDVLEAVTNFNFKEFVELLVSKLRLGGKIIFDGNDFYQCCVSYLNGSLSENDISLIFSGAKGFYNSRIIEDELSKYLNITKVQVYNCNFTVIGERID